MKNLHEQFNMNIRTLYSAKEMSEILISMYTSIELAIKIGADKLKLTPSQALHLDKDGKILYESSIFQSQLISNIEILDLIRSRDNLVKDKLELITRNNSEAVYKII